MWFYEYDAYKAYGKWIELLYVDNDCFQQFIHGSRIGHITYCCVGCSVYWYAALLR